MKKSGSVPFRNESIRELTRRGPAIDDVPCNKCLIPVNRITTYRLDSFELADTLSLHPEMNQLPIGWSGYDATPVAALSSETFLVAFSRERNPAYEPTGVIHYYGLLTN